MPALNLLLRLLVVYGCILVPSMNAAGQAPLRGVVWNQPEDVNIAMSQLMEMDSIGVQAVRTGIARHEYILALADTLDIQLFQELPIAYLPASGLRDTVAYARGLLERLLPMAEKYQSARHIGLARMSDTSDPAACVYFEQLATYIREQGPSGIRSYYVTPFIEDDQCGGTVDLVLLNAADEESPASLLEAWYSERDSVETAVGIGVLGMWAHSDGTGGRAGRSELAQARYLENQLNILLHGRTAVRPYAVFIYSWADLPIDEAPLLGGVSLTRPTYGLSTAEGSRRPAYEVVRGIYTGRQMVFALDQEAERGAEWPWRILLGWGAISLLSVFYAASPRLRFMIPRYFTAHGFYRDAVREGRDVLASSSATLLVVLSLTSGLVLSVFLEQVGGEPGFAVFLRWTTEPVREFILALQQEPWMAVLLCACAYSIAALLWSAVLSLISRRRYVLAPSQTIMLVVWPRWPLLLLLLVAMVIPSLPEEAALTMTLAMAGCWFAITLLMLFRTTYDFAVITRVSFPFVILAWLASPLALLAIALAVLIAANVPEAAFLYHLATRA